MTDRRSVGISGLSSSSPSETIVRPGAYVRRMWDREVPAAWHQLLYQHLPSSGPVILQLAWEPGDPWRPVERWMVYETWARWWVAEHDPDRLKELEGPNPRQDVDHYCGSGFCQCAVKKNKLVYNDGAYTPTKIDYWQWRFYQTHRRSPLRYWTIQGDDGGHRFALTPYESKLYQMHKGISDTPAPGRLPYADFTTQTLAHLLAYEPMRRRLFDEMWKGKAAGIKAIEAEEERTRLAQRAAAQQYHADRAKENADLLGFAMRRTDPYQRVYTGTREDRVADERRNDPDVIAHNFLHDE